MPERIVVEDPTIPQPGNRSGSGSSSLLPFLAKTLASKPKAPHQSDYRDTPPETLAGDLEPPPGHD
jgi:hypothetical protein